MLVSAVVSPFAEMGEPAVTKIVDSDYRVDFVLRDGAFVAATAFPDSTTPVPSVTNAPSTAFKFVTGDVASFEVDVERGFVKLYRNTVLLATLLGKPGSGAVFEVDNVAPCTPVVRPLDCIACTSALCASPCCGVVDGIPPALRHRCTCVAEKPRW